MALTPQGFAGTVDEVASATIQGDLPARIVSGFELTGSTTARTASVGVGVANSHGVAVTNDQAIVRTYATPTNGQWYLTCLRRTWNGAGVTAKVEIVDLAGAATAAGAADPAVPPSTFPTLNLRPGVIEDSPIGWVWVSGTAAKTLVFDARLTPDGAGGISVPDPWTLNAYVSAGVIVATRTIGGQLFTDAPGISMAQFSPTGPANTADVIRASRWVARAGNGVTGTYRPLHTLRASTSAALTALTALLNGALPRATAFANETKGYVEGGSAGGINFLYVGAGNCAAADAPASAAWQAWEKAPASWTFNPTNLGVGTGPARGTPMWGISGGRAWLYSSLGLGTTPSVSTSGDVSFTAPTLFVAQAAYGGGTAAPGTGANQQADLVLYPVQPTNGYSTNTVRIRARYANATGASVKQNILGSAYTPAAGDGFSFEMSGVSGVYA